MADAPQLILYGRHACHLCDEMQAQLQSLLQTGQICLELRDVDEREDWRRDYGPRVPLLMDKSGYILGEYHLDGTALSDWLVRTRAEHM